MKKLLFLIVTLFWLIPELGKAQITIHPEVGGSYFPFLLEKGPPLLASNRVDFLFGVSGYFPINDKLTAQTRISFTDRENFNSYHPNSDSNYLYTDFIRSELNIDFRINFILSKYLDLGLGTSIIRTFATNRNAFLDKNKYIDYSYTSFNWYSGGINAGFSLKRDRWRFNLSYLRVIRIKDRRFYPLGRNRYDLTVSYHLLGGNKEKKR